MSFALKAFNYYPFFFVVLRSKIHLITLKTGLIVHKWAIDSAVCANLFRTNSTARIPCVKSSFFYIAHKSSIQTESGNSLHRVWFWRTACLVLVRYGKNFSRVYFEAAGSASRPFGTSQTRDPGRLLVAFCKTASRYSWRLLGVE